MSENKRLTDEEIEAKVAEARDLDFYLCSGKEFAAIVDQLRADLRACEAENERLKALVKNAIDDLELGRVDDTHASLTELFEGKS